MRTLRSRLIFSHILPILIVTPLIGIAIYAVLLTQGTLASMETALRGEAQRLTEEANLYADLSGQVQAIRGPVSRPWKRCRPPARRCRASSIRRWRSCSGTVPDRRNCSRPSKRKWRSRTRRCNSSAAS